MSVHAGPHASRGRVSIDDQGVPCFPPATEPALPRRSQ